MFLGTYTPKLDDKGRLTLPAKFREELAGGLMVTKGQDHSLAVYPKEEFMQRARKAAEVSRTNPEARAFIRNLAASADEQRPDGQGRITAQLVGGVGGELALGGQAARDALGGADQLGLNQVDLLDTGGAQARADLTAAQLLGLSGQVDQGRGQAPGGLGGHHCGRCQGDHGENEDGEHHGDDGADLAAAVRRRAPRRMRSVVHHRR